MISAKAFLSTDVAEHRSIFKNYQNTHYHTINFHTRNTHEFSNTDFDVFTVITCTE